MWLTSREVIFWCWSCSQNLPYNVPALTHASPTLFNGGCKAPGWRFSSGIHSLLTSIFWVWLACRRSLYVPLLCPWLRWLLVHRQAKMELIIFWQDCWSLNEDTIDFFNHYISWGLADVMTESPHWFWNCNRNLGHRCLYNGLPDFGWSIIKLSTSSVWECGVMEANAAIHDEGDGLALCVRHS
jgi:hypothetical protein